MALIMSVCTQRMQPRLTNPFMSILIDYIYYKSAKLTDLSMTMSAAVPRPVWAWMRPSKSINTSSHTFLGMRGVEEPPGMTASRLSQPPRTPPTKQLVTFSKNKESSCYKTNKWNKRIYYSKFCSSWFWEQGISITKVYNLRPFKLSETRHWCHVK